jgi:hypothetical protein
MKKSISPEIIVKYKFGNKGVNEIKGFLFEVGISENGKYWFSLLKWRKLTERIEGIEYDGWILVKEAYKLENVVEGKEQLLPYFQDLK